MTGALLSTAGQERPPRRAAPGGTATAATTATAKSSRLALTSRVQTTITQPWLLAAGRAAATKHVCRALPNLVSVGWQRVGRGGGREPGCLARGASHCLHCSDQGRGSCHSQAVLLGRKGQDGDLGAAPVLSTLWQRRGTAGARGLLQAFGALLLPSPWFPSTWSPCKLVWKPAQNDRPGFYWTC